MATVALRSSSDHFGRLTHKISQLEASIASLIRGLTLLSHHQATASTPSKLKFSPRSPQNEDAVSLMIFKTAPMIPFSAKPNIVKRKLELIRYVSCRQSREVVNKISIGNVLSIRASQ